MPDNRSCYGNNYGSNRNNGNGNRNGINDVSYGRRSQNPSRNYNSGNSSCNCSRPDRRQLMEEIRACNFAVTDIGMFLDTNPNNEEALECCNDYRDMYEDAVREYEKHYGPLSVFGNDNCEKWEWCSAPWPWEGDAD